MQQHGTPCESDHAQQDQDKAKVLRFGGSLRIRIDLLHEEEKAAGREELGQCIPTLARRLRTDFMGSGVALFPVLGQFSRRWRWRFRGLELLAERCQFFIRHRAVDSAGDKMSNLILQACHQALSERFGIELLERAVCIPGLMESPELCWVRFVPYHNSCARDWIESPATIADSEGLVVMRDSPDGQFGVNFSVRTGIRDKGGD